MQQTKRNRITEIQWKRAAEAYELGTKPARQIAAELGVSPSTVSREFKHRGCVKACRVAETIAPLVAELDAKDRQKALRRNAEIDAAAVRSAALNRMIDEMMRTIVAAAKSGDLSKAAPMIEEVGGALGVKSLR